MLSKKIGTVKIVSGISLVMISVLPSFAADITFTGTIPSALSVSIEKGDGSNTVIADDVTPGTVSLGNLDGFAANLGNSAVIDATSVMLVKSDTNILVTRGTGGDFNDGGAIYPIGANASETTTGSLKIRMRVQGGGNASLSFIRNAAGTLPLLYSKSDTAWSAGTSMATLHPEILNTSVVLAGALGFVRTAKMADNETILLDLAAKVTPGVVTGSKSSIITFTAAP